MKALGVLMFLLSSALWTGVAWGQGFGSGAARRSTEVSFSQDAPALWENDSLPKRPRGGPPPPAKAVFGDSLSDAIRRHYLFLGDFEEREAREVPQDWVDPAKEPLRALLLGTPGSFKRPRLVFQFPLFRLKARLRFVGTDASIFLLNTAVSHWAAGENQEASNAFARFESEIPRATKLGAAPASTAAWLVRGFFYLDMAAQGAALKGRKDDSSPEKPELTFGELMFLVRQSFSRAMARLTPEMLLKGGRSLDSELSRSLLECPFFPEDGGGSAPPCTVDARERNVAPEAWVRSVAVAAYWNLLAAERNLGGWESVFDTAEHLEKLIALLPLRDAALPREHQDAVLAPRSPVMASSPIRVWPQSLPDLLAASALVRSGGLLQQKDPMLVLRYADQVIRFSRSSEMAALGFLLAGVSYFDLNAHLLAKQAFAWCEAVSRTLSEKVPTCLLLGAESAFWESRFAAADAGFARFLSIAGDKEFAPWVDFRRHLLAHRRGEVSEARAGYAELARLYPEHSVTTDARVRDFCIQTINEGLATENRRQWLGSLQPGLAKMRDALRLQARTCLLWTELENVAEESGQDASRVAAEAARQKDLFVSYRKDHPTSPFLVLFEERMARLNLAQVVQLVSDADCPRLVDEYQKNRKELEDLGGRGTRYLASLGWKDDQRLLVMRCAALVGKMGLWDELRRTPLGRDGGRLHELAFRFRRKMDPADGVALAQALAREVETGAWADLVDKAERAGKGFVRDTEFWRGYAAGMLFQFDLSAKARSREAFRRTVLKGLLSSPESALTSPVVCAWVVAEAHTLGGKVWDRIAVLRTSEQWLAGIEGKEEAGTISCFRPLATTLLTLSQESPSPVRDERVVVPFLEKKGVAAAGEAWLAFAQREATRKGRGSKAVKSVYEKIAKDASDAALRNVARAWLEGNSP